MVLSFCPGAALLPGFPVWPCCVWLTSVCCISRPDKEWETFLVPDKYRNPLNPCAKLPNLSNFFLRDTGNSQIGTANRALESRAWAWRYGQMFRGGKARDWEGSAGYPSDLGVTPSQIVERWPPTVENCTSKGQPSFHSFPMITGGTITGFHVSQLPGARVFSKSTFLKGRISS